MGSSVKFLRGIVNNVKGPKLQILGLGKRTDNSNKSLYQVTGGESKGRFKHASKALNNNNNFFSAVTETGPHGEPLNKPVMLVESNLDLEGTKKAIATAFSP